jgi:Fe-S-cluster containining protein
MTFRPCGDCSACCEGHIRGNSYGNLFGYHKPCVFLVDKACSIYKDRPNTCKAFQCAWSQGLFPEWMKPNLTGIIISVETNSEYNKQYLRATEISPIVNNSVYTELEAFCSSNNTYYIKVPYETNSKDPRL